MRHPGRLWRLSCHILHHRSYVREDNISRTFVLARALLLYLLLGYRLGPLYTLFAASMSSRASDCKSRSYDIGQLCNATTYNRLNPSIHQPSARGVGTLSGTLTTPRPIKDLTSSSTGPCRDLHVTLASMRQGNIVLAQLTQGIAAIHLQAQFRPSFQSFRLLVSHPLVMVQWTITALVSGLREPA